MKGRCAVAVPGQRRLSSAGRSSTLRAYENVPSSSVKTWAAPPRRRASAGSRVQCAGEPYPPQSAPFQPHAVAQFAPPQAMGWRQKRPSPGYGQSDEGQAMPRGEALERKGRVGAPPVPRREHAERWHQ